MHHNIYSLICELHSFAHVAAPAQWHRISDPSQCSHKHMLGKTCWQWGHRWSTMLANCKGYLITNHINSAKYQSIIFQATIPEDFIFGLNVMRCLVALLVSDRNFDVDFINESCKRVAKLTSPIRRHTISTAILNLQNSIFCQPVVTHDRQSIAMRGRLNPPRSHTRSHRNHTSTKCMQLPWHFEALVLPINCERPVVIQINLTCIPEADEHARRAPTLMHSSPQPFCKMPSVCTIASCHDLAGSVLSSWAVAKNTLHAKSSKKHDITNNNKCRKLYAKSLAIPMLSWTNVSWPLNSCARDI